MGTKKVQFTTKVEPSPTWSTRSSVAVTPRDILIDSQTPRTDYPPSSRATVEDRTRPQRAKLRENDPQLPNATPRDSKAQTQRNTPRDDPRSRRASNKTGPRSQKGPRRKLKRIPSGTEAGTQMIPDLTNRDPTPINDHIKVGFEDVLGEPESVQSVDCVWRGSYCCYTCWRRCCYKMFTLFCGCPLAAVYGILYFHTAFRHVWVCTPFRLLLETSLVHCVSRCIKLILNCAIAPCLEACGQVFYVFNPKSKRTVLPYARKKMSRVQFSDAVRTKRIPRDSGAPAWAVL